MSKDKVVDIEEYKGFKVADEKDERYKPTRDFNIIEVIAQLNKKCEAYESDEMIGVEDWNGDCLRTFFNVVCREVADKYDVDQWDVLAAFVHEIFGK